MAQNINCEAVVLENPRFKDFKKEVDQGDYQVLCFSFTIITAKYILPLIQWVKDNHPRIKIILGGYGTAIFSENPPIGEELKALSDEMCFGEGLSFLNDYLYDNYSVERKTSVTQTLIRRIPHLLP